jgi:hypothetical protein
MDEEQPPAKPRLVFGRGRAGSASAPAARKHVPVEDALSGMAGKIGERRRAAVAAGRGDDAEDDDGAVGLTA